MKLDMISRYPETTPKPTPLLFVHGSFADARCWDENFLPHCARHGYEAHAFSMRGHGRSEGHEHLHTWRLADYIADLAKAVGNMPAPPVLIGHSMGGMVVQKYLEDHAAIAGVVLMASVPPQGLLPTNLHMAMRHPFLFQQMALFSLLGPTYGTPEMMRRLQTEVIDMKPDLVIWQVGTNAVLRNLDQAETARLVEEGVNRAHQRGTLARTDMEIGADSALSGGEEHAKAYREGATGGGNGKAGGCGCN